MDLRDRTDEDLVQSVAQGDPAAFEALYDRYQDWITALAFRFSGNREDALDVLQETFTYFFRKSPGFELRSRLKTFFFPVVKHLALSRKAIRSRPLPRERAAGESPEERPPGDAVEPLLKNLSEPQKEVVLMRFADGLDLREIAEALEIPLGTVKSRLHGALEILRRDLPNR